MTMKEIEEIETMTQRTLSDKEKQMLMKIGE